jgi:hypothetical protein
MLPAYFIQLAGLQWVLVWQTIEGRITPEQAQAIWFSMLNNSYSLNSFWEMHSALVNAMMLAGVKAP